MIKSNICLAISAIVALPAAVYSCSQKEAPIHAIGMSAMANTALIFASTQLAKLAFEKIKATVVSPRG